MRWLFTLLILPLALLGQSTNWPSAPDTTASLLVQSNYVNTTLSGAQSSSSTVLVVNSSSQIVAGLMLQVDQEMEKIVSGSGNSWTVIRGQDSSSQTPHAVGAPVKGYAGVSSPASAYHNGLSAAIRAMQANPFRTQLVPPTGACSPNGAWTSYLNTTTNANTLYFCSNGSWQTFSGGGGGGGSGTVTSVALTVPSWLTISGSPIISAGTLAVSAASGQTTHQVIGTGSSASFGPVTLGTADLPFTYSGNTTVLGTVSGSLTNTHLLKADASGNIVDGGAPVAGGTVTSVTFTGDGTVLSSTPSAAVTTSGTVTAALRTALAHTVLGNFTGSTATPTYGSLTTAELPFTYGGNTTKLGTTTGSLTNGHCVSIDANGNFVDSGQAGCGGGGAGGTVTSVGFAAPTGFSVTGSPVATSGTLTLVMPTSWTTGDLLLGNGANSVSRLAIGANGTYLKSNGSTASWQAGGTVTSVGLTAPAEITVGGSPVTTTGTLALTWTNAAAHKYFGNATGSATTPSFSSIGTGDLPYTYGGNTTKLGTTTGTLTNGHCVSIDANGNFVDAGTGCAGAGGNNFANSETPSGTLNGINTTFTLVNSPNPALSLQMNRNGLEQVQGVDYTISGGTITFLAGAIPQAGDTLRAFYRF